MNTETTIEKAKAVIEEMRELLAKLEAERTAPRRNWPEKVEAGMVFRARHGYENAGGLFVAAEDEEPFLLQMATGRFYNRGKYFWDERPWERYEYLGMAANGLVWSDPTEACMNATDAHEPTGGGAGGEGVRVLGLWREVVWAQ